MFSYWQHYVFMWLSASKYMCHTVMHHTNQVNSQTAVLIQATLAYHNMLMLPNKAACRDRGMDMECWHWCKEIMFVLITSSLVEQWTYSSEEIMWYQWEKKAQEKIKIQNAVKKSCLYWQPAIWQYIEQQTWLSEVMMPKVWENTIQEKLRDKWCKYCKQRQNAIK